MSTNYLTITDILPAILWLVIILVIGYSIRSANRDKPHYKYYMINLYTKLFFSLAFAAVFIFYYGGGDTTAYFDGAIKLNNLFFKSPSMYFEEILNEPNNFRFETFYDLNTGRPPGWIYREPEAFFISKLMSILSFFTLKSYFAMTFIMAFLSSLVSWKLFEFVRFYGIHNEKLLAIGTLLIPSVNFWCTGISKDTVVVISTILIICHFYTIISSNRPTNFWNYLMLILSGFIILHIRPFILYILAIPFLFALSSKFLKLLGGGKITIITFRVLIIIGGVVFVGSALISQSESEFLDSSTFLQEASVVQSDFSQNDTYGDKRYDLGEFDFTPAGLLTVTPMAMITGMYRPFPWEALSATLIFNGLESLMFMYFTFLFIRRDFFKKLRMIGKEEILIFSLTLVLLVSFATGLTSVLFGVLVRQRAILIPFLFLLLTVDIKQIELNQKILETDESTDK